MSGKRTPNGTPTVRKWCRLPVELAGWLEETAATRDVSESLIVTRALERYREDLPQAPPADRLEMLEQLTAELGRDL